MGVGPQDKRGNRTYIKVQNRPKISPLKGRGIMEEKIHSGNGNKIIPKSMIHLATF